MSTVLSAFKKHSLDFRKFNFEQAVTMAFYVQKYHSKDFPPFYDFIVKAL